MLGKHWRESLRNKINSLCLLKRTAVVRSGGGEEFYKRRDSLIKLCKRALLPNQNCRVRLRRIKFFYARVRVRVYAIKHKSNSRLHFSIFLVVREHYNILLFKRELNYQFEEHN